jgi:beta-lactamase regulating signal transducer with metallopeptidase domain
MTPVVDVLHLVSPAVADVLVASVWQSVLLTGAIALCLRLVPGVPAGVRSGIWTAVLVLIVLLPAVSAGIPHVGVGESRAVHLASDWSLGLLFFWAMLSLLRAVELCVSAVRLRTLARSAEPVEVDATIAPLLEFGTRRAVLCTSELVDRPSVVGFFRPRILLSPDLLESLSQPELEQIVLHEMEHVRRGDPWTNLLQQVSLVLLPWNPAVLWLNRRLCFERELACDDGVVRATKARKAYAACLVRLAEDSMLRRGLSLTLGALGAFESRARDSELVTRVQRILTVAEPVKRSRSLRAATAAVIAGALGLTALLARSPRLIDFANAPVSVAATDSSEMQALPTALRVNRAGVPRPMLVKAIVSGPGSPRVVMTPAVLHKHPDVRRRKLHAAEPVHTTRAQVWHDPVSVSHPVKALVSANASQRLYAAVPWQGGWLLIQL